MDGPLPVLDLDRYRQPSLRPAFVAELRAALHEVGFLYLTGHGVDPGLNRSVLDVAGRFFSLPDADRLAIANIGSPQFRGYTPLGTEHTNGRADRRDQVDIGPELPAPVLGPDSPPWLRLRGPNLWPAALPIFRPVLSAWMAAMQDVGRTVLAAVAEVLGQPPDHFHPYLQPHPEDRVKVIRYPAAAGVLEVGGVDDQGVGAHRDNGLLTFIHQDDVGGLEVELGGRFLPVPGRAGAFVLNIGEMLQLLSHGYLRATVHRVVPPPPGPDRLSLAYFYNPAYEATLVPVELPASLACEAPGGASTDASNPILASYGANALKVRLRSHPDVARRHHADLLAAESPDPV